MSVFFRTLGEKGREDLAASAFTAEPNELVEWFEDAVDSSRSLLVNLLRTANDERVAALQRFYESLVRHERFGGGWPARLPAQALAPRLPATTVGPASRLHWLAICCTGDPCAEQAQLAEQMAQLHRLPDPPAWIDDLSFGGFQAALHPHTFESEGDRADHSIAIFGHPLGGAASSLRAVTRSLDRAVQPHHLLADGGALEADGPRIRARALVTAGLIERLAGVAPFVLVVDEAHRASSFVVQLVQLLMRGPASGLVVLAGPTLVAGRDPRDREWLLTHGCDQPPANVARAAAAVAVIARDRVFSRSQFDAAALAVSTADPAATRDALVATGWIRPLTFDVWMFATDEHQELLRIQALRLLGDRAIRELPAHVAASLPRAQYDHPLTALVQLAAAASIDPQSDAAWSFATTLASWGELRRAISVGEAVRPTSERLAVLESWRCSEGFSDGAATSPADPSSWVLHGATATTSRASKTAALQMALDSLPLETEENDADPSSPLRLALFRAWLSVGDIANARQALGQRLTQYLSDESKAVLRNVEALEGRHEMIARSTRVVENLIAIATLQELTGESAAFGLACLERLELLEAVGRLDDATDAEYLADAACRILARYHAIAPEDCWNARQWRAWLKLRIHGDVSAIADLEALVDEIRAADPAKTQTILRAEQWLARSKGYHADPNAAIDDFDAMIPRAIAEFDGDAPEALDLYQWRGEMLAHAGRYEQSVEALGATLDRRLATSSPDDEAVLVTKLRLACSIADAGDPAAALPMFDEVIRRRELIDSPEAPRLVAARHARSICLIKLARIEDALIDLDAVIDARTRTFSPVDHVALAARSERARGFLVLQRWSDAIEELEGIIRVRSQTLPTDHIDLLNWRQQRVIGLLGAGRTQDAFDEINNILQTASGSYSADHPLIVSLYQLGTFLADSATQIS